MWSVVAEDGHHNAAPGGFIIASSEKSNILAAGLRVLIENVPGEPFRPNWMTDKDEKERKALKYHLADIVTGQVTLTQKWLLKNINLGAVMSISRCKNMEKAFDREN